MSRVDGRKKFCHHQSWANGIPKEHMYKDAIAADLGHNLLCSLGSVQSYFAQSDIAMVVSNVRACNN